MEMKNAAGQSYAFEYSKFQCPYFPIVTRYICSMFCYIFLAAITFLYSNNCTLDSVGRCRWNPNPDEPLIFVKYDFRHLNILDAVKKALILKGPIQIESKGKRSTFGFTIFLIIYLKFFFFSLSDFFM